MADTTTTTTVEPTWTDTPPVDPKKAYVWTKTTYTYSDGTSEDKYTVAPASGTSNPLLDVNTATNMFSNKSEIINLKSDIHRETSYSDNLISVSTSVEGGIDSEGKDTSSNRYKRTDYAWMILNELTTGDYIQLYAKSANASNPVTVSAFLYYVLDYQTSTTNYVNIPVEGNSVTSASTKSFATSSIKIPDYPSDGDPLFKYFAVRFTFNYHKGDRVGARLSDKQKWMPGADDIALKEDLEAPLTELYDAHKSERYGNFNDIDKRFESIELMLAALVPGGYSVEIDHQLKYNPVVSVKSYDYAIGTEPSGLGSGPAGTFGGTETVRVTSTAKYPSLGKILVDLPLNYKLTGTPKMGPDGNYYLIDGYHVLKFELGDPVAGSSPQYGASVFHHADGTFDIYVLWDTGDTTDLLVNPTSKIITDTSTGVVYTDGTSSQFTINDTSAAGVTGTIQVGFSNGNSTLIANSTAGNETIRTVIFDNTGFLLQDSGITDIAKFTSVAAGSDANTHVLTITFTDGTKEVLTINSSADGNVTDNKGVVITKGHTGSTTLGNFVSNQEATVDIFHTYTNPPIANLSDCFISYNLLTSKVDLAYDEYTNPNA